MNENYETKIHAYLKKNNIDFDKTKEYLQKYTEDEFDKLIKQHYKISGNVTAQKILNAKKIDTLPDEHEEQKQVLAWCKKNKIKYFAVPNGFMTDLGYKYINYMRAEGLVNGSPDLVILLGNGNVLFLEMKRVKGGVLSEHQKKWQQYFNDNDYNYFVAKGHIEAIEQIEKLRESKNNKKLYESADAVIQFLNKKLLKFTKAIEKIKSLIQITNIEKDFNYNKLTQIIMNICNDILNNAKP